MRRERVKPYCLRLVLVYNKTTEAEPCTHSREVLFRSNLAKLICRWQSNVKTSIIKTGLKLDSKVIGYAGNRAMHFDFKTKYVKLQIF